MTKKRQNVTMTYDKNLKWQKVKKLNKFKLTKNYY